MCICASDSYESGHILPHPGYILAATSPTHFGSDFNSFFAAFVWAFGEPIWGSNSVFGVQHLVDFGTLLY